SKAKLVKISPILILLLCTIPRFSGAADFSAENKYDILSKTLTPVMAIFAEETKSGNRAFTLQVRLEQMTDLPPDLAGAKAELLVEYPDKLRISTPVLGQPLTVCRRGTKLWVTPGSKVRELLEREGVAPKLPPPDP